MQLKEIAFSNLALSKPDFVKRCVFVCVGCCFLFVWCGVFFLLGGRVCFCFCFCCFVIVFSSSSFLTFVVVVVVVVVVAVGGPSGFTPLTLMSLGATVHVVAYFWKPFQALLLAVKGTNRLSLAWLVLPVTRHE